MRTPASAVHYGSMVLHNFLATSRVMQYRGPARYVLAHPSKAATFGRRVANEAQLRGRSLTHRELHVLLSEPI